MEEERKRTTAFKFLTRPHPARPYLKVSQPPQAVPPPRDHVLKDVSVRVISHPVSEALILITNMFTFMPTLSCGNAEKQGVELDTRRSAWGAW